MRRIRNRKMVGLMRRVRNRKKSQNSKKDRELNENLIWVPLIYGLKVEIYKLIMMRKKYYQCKLFVGTFYVKLKKESNIYIN